MANQWSFTLFYVFVSAKCPPLPFTTPLMLLVVRHVVGVVGSLCFYAMVKYYPLPMPCGGGGTLLKSKKKCKKNLTFAYVSNQN